MATGRQKAQRSAAPAQESHRRLERGRPRFFLELVRTGSHSGGARRLGVARNTVSVALSAAREALAVRA